MNEHDTQDTGTPPPLPRPKGITILGRISVFVSVWNFLCVLWMWAIIPRGESAEATHLGAVMTWQAMLIWAPVCAFWFVASLGLLKQRLWGYRCTIVAFLLVAACGVAYLIGTAVPEMRRASDMLMWGIMLIPTLIGIGLTAWGLWALLRYLKRPAVRQAFH